MGKISRWAPRKGVSTALLAGSLGFGALAVLQSAPCPAAFPGANAKIAYFFGGTSTDSIWSVNADGSSPTRLTSGSEDHEPAYSAAGSELAFQRGNDVVVVNADGSGERLVLAGRASKTSEAKWLSDYKTPTGEIIPFIKIATITAESHYFRDPSFSPDGHWLAVVEGTENTVSTTYCAVGEEEGQECLVEGDPDSYFDHRFECECKSQIIEAKSEDGGSIKKITPAESGVQFRTPAFSANGALAYVRSSPSTPGSAIFVIRPAGTSPKQITSGPHDYAPDFSPNGVRLVFSHGRSDLGLVGATGGLLTILPIANPAGSEGSLVESPVFSPDESRIAFGRSVLHGGGEVERGIYTIGSDGSGMVKIVDRGFAPSWQSTVPARPLGLRWASAKAIERVKLDKKHMAVIGRITCGSWRCKLAVTSSRLKVGKEVCSLKTILARKLAPEKSTKVKVKVVGRCLAALEEGQVGSFLMDVKVVGGPHMQMLTMEARLWVPAKPAHGSPGRHRRH